MGLKKYEVKESEFPKKEGTDDFAMSAGFFEYLDKTHDFQSKAAIENYCKYWTDRHSVDHPDAAKYNKFALWEQYKDNILFPWKKIVIPVIVAGIILGILYLVGGTNFTPSSPDITKLYIDSDEPTYKCVVTNQYRSKVDFTEVEFKVKDKYKYYPVINGSEYLKMNQGIKNNLIFKFIEGGVIVDNLNNYEKIKLSDLDQINNKVYLKVEGTYKQYYLAGGVQTGFLDKYVRIMDNYIIEIESINLYGIGTLILFTGTLLILLLILKKVVGL